jgi:hypothetical protein
VSDPIDTSIDTCGCCEPDPASAHLYNRPGLPALSYRDGTYVTFFRRMLEELGRFTLPDGEFSETRPLTALTIRASDDPSIALLDASAMMADILTFYQERIANEGFLRTAVERRSILELARAIGYELNPGVDASVYLAFTVEDALGAPRVADVPSGTKVQSVPPQNKLPQTFETSSDITARADWNAIRPHLSGKQDLTKKNVRDIYLSGTTSNIQPGDVILVETDKDIATAHVQTVDIDPINDRTRLGLKKPISFTIPEPPAPAITKDWGDKKIPFLRSTVRQFIQEKTWTESGLNAFLKANEWSPKKLADYLAKDRVDNPATVGKVFVLRTRLGIFGHNAPRYASLPMNQRIPTMEIKYINNTPFPELHFPAYPSSWDETDICINHNSQDKPYPDTEADFFLERSVPALKDGDFFALETRADGLQGFEIRSVFEGSLRDYGMSAKVTGITAQRTEAKCTPLDEYKTKFKTRFTSAFVQSESLALTEAPFTEKLHAGIKQLKLNGFYFGLQIGQPVILSGERSDAMGVMHSEVFSITGIVHDRGMTILTFDHGMAYGYKRTTVTINANVAHASHGETITEILGSGDGTQANQRFILKKPPLTFTSASALSGSVSTLQIKVNNQPWDEVASLYSLGPKDQAYTVRIDDQHHVTVTFGDGHKGARLPTGSNNVVAIYRSGIGSEGEVGAGSLTILQSKPLGVRSVTNPLPAGNAANPEGLGAARDHAPLTVRTLDRIVSLDDYQDFASAFAGIGKAQAINLWADGRHFVYLTIGGANGEPVTDQDFLDNFSAALEAARDPVQQVKVGTFDRLLFDLSASIAVDRHHEKKEVDRAVRAALVMAFSFDRRAFGQAVSAAEVITIIQGVPGVVSVDLNALNLSGSPTANNLLGSLTNLNPSINPAVISLVGGPVAVNQLLVVDGAHVGGDGTIRPAQLLLINTQGLTLKEVRA